MRYRDTKRKGQDSRFILNHWDSEGDNLLIENHITERFLYERKENDSYGGGSEWYKVRGGKYTRETLDHTVASYKWASEKEGRVYRVSNPVESIPNETIVDRPLCKCHCPSEVKLSKDKTKIYFVCALKNIWDNFCSPLQANNVCDFWQLYTEEKELIKNYSSTPVRC